MGKVQTPQGLPTAHAEFDAHYLRRFAHALPFYFRPQLESTPFTVQQFTEDFHRRLHPILEERGKRELMTLLQERTLVRQHIGFTFLERFVRLHTEQEGFEDALAYVRHDLSRISRAGVMSLSSPHHPLYSNCRARYALSIHEIPMRVIDVTVKDKKIADQMRELPFENIVPTIAPEYLTLHPDCRIARCSARLRENMRLSLTHANGFTDGERDVLINKITDEWLSVRSSQIGKSRDEIHNANALGAAVGALEQELKIGDIARDPPLQTMEKLLPILQRDESTFRRFLPLLEQFLIDLAQRHDDDNLAELVVAVQMLGQHHHVIHCDLPGLGLALLAVRTRFGAKNDLAQTI